MPLAAGEEAVTVGSRLSTRFLPPRDRACPFINVMAHNGQPNGFGAVLLPRVVALLGTAPALPLPDGEREGARAFSAQRAARLPQADRWHAGPGLINMRVGMA